jgi:hypothetical protein
MVDDGFAEDEPFRHREGGGDGEGHGDELKRRHLADAGRQQRERRPQDDGDRPDQRRARRAARRRGSQAGRTLQRAAGTAALSTYAGRR